VEIGIFPIAILTIIASAVSIVAGFGTSTIMVPILIYFLPLPEVLLLTGIIHWFNDGWRLLFYRLGIRWTRLILAASAGIPASLVGAWLVIRTPQHLIFRALGIMLIFYVVFIYINPSFKMKRNRRFAIAGGIFSGFLSGLLGISGEATSIVLSLLDLPKETFIAIGSAFTLIIDISRVGAYASEGIRLDPALFDGLIIFIPASLLGALVGRMAIGRIPQNRFRRILMAFLLAAGLKLALFP
jgi:uncharacterized membrane protein YfcA